MTETAILKAVEAMLEMYCETQQKNCDNCPLSIKQFDTCLWGAIVNINVEHENKNGGDK